MNGNANWGFTSEQLFTVCMLKRKFFSGMGLNEFITARPLAPRLVRSSSTGLDSQPLAHRFTHLSSQSTFFIRL